MFTGLLPPSVVVVRATESMYEGRLYPEEAACVERAVPQRVRDFTAGRLSAREALRRLGLAPTPLTRGPQREVNWPPGVLGSITHCEGECYAAVTRADDIQGLGIDVETRGRMDAGVLALVCTENERAWIGSQAQADADLLARLIFSAKESVYKCCFGVAGRFIDFDDVEIEWSAETRRYRARWVTPALRECFAGSELQGRARVGAQHVYTAAVLQRSPSS